MSPFAPPDAPGKGVYLTVRDVGWTLHPSQPVSVKAEAWEVTTDMLELADTFQLDLPFTRELWSLVATDAEVEISIDGRRVLVGYVDTRGHSGSKGGSSIRVEGRDKGGRLVDESAPLLNFVGMDVEAIVRKVVEPWFASVVLSNARNRTLIKGPGGAVVGGEPALLDLSHHTGKKLREHSRLTSAATSKDVRRNVTVGEARADVLHAIFEQADVLGWSTADGRDFVVGRPNYSQAPQWRFFAPAPGSARLREASVETFDYVESIGERYARLTVVGTSRGNTADYSSNVLGRRATVLNNPDSVDGTGKEFRRPKDLLIGDDDIRTAEQAKTRALREQAVRDAGGRALSLTVPGFGQQFFTAAGQPAGPEAIFAFDTIGSWEDEEAGISGDYLITRARFYSDKEGGEMTDLELVPRGTELRAR